MADRDLAAPLAAWLPRQRWFAGGGVPVSAVSIASEVVLAAGDPEFRHVLADVDAGGQVIRYQVPVGLRPGLPDSLAGAEIGPVGGGLVAYDASRDPEFAGLLLRGIAGRLAAGPLRFAAEPGAEIDAGLPGRALQADQSNTSIVYGDQAILKLLRRPYPGRHPDLELTSALARRGSDLVAAPLGWIEAAPDPVVPAPRLAEQPGTAERAPETTVLAILSRFYPGAETAWALAIDSLRGERPDFAPAAGQLGEATARLHAQLADACGTGVMDRDALTALAKGMTSELDQALGVVPGLVAHAAEVRACYSAAAAFTGPVLVQRIHGDYHLAQVISAAGRWIVLDFEGEPSVPLERRRSYSSPLRDVAGMLRSFDYAARHQLVGPGAGGAQAGTTAGGTGTAGAALSWASRCQHAFLDGYASAGPDPRDSEPLLKAFTLQKAVYEAVYEARHRPAWLDIPLSAIAAA